MHAVLTPSITLNRVVGVGRYSVVHKSQCGSYAIKVIPRHKRDTTENETHIDKEINSWTHITNKSAYATPLISYFEHYNSVKLVSPLYNKGVLDYGAMKKIEGNHKAIATIIYRLARCLREMHDDSIAHGDINEENIMVESIEDGKVFLNDFGSTISGLEAFTGASEHNHSNIYYMAPEMLNGKSFGYNTDVWSLGVIAFQLMNGGEYPFINRMIIKESSTDGDYPIFLKPSIEEMANAYKSRPIRWNKDTLKTIPESGVDLVMHMLQRIAWSRYNADAVLNHPYIRQYADLP